MTTDASGSNPFAGFAGFKPADMMDRMWDMMRMSPFGGMTSFPGATQGLPPSLSSMSDMMAPLTSVEELDKRITDLRAVEQWLKLNLGMLQSAIQALEVQRATLATLRAFGAFAQSSMSAAEEAAVAAAHAAKHASGRRTMRRRHRMPTRRRQRRATPRSRPSTRRAGGACCSRSSISSRASRWRSRACSPPRRAMHNRTRPLRRSRPRSRHRPPPRRASLPRSARNQPVRPVRRRARRRIVARNPSAEALDVTRRS